MSQKLTSKSTDTKASAANANTGAIQGKADTTAAQNKATEALGSVEVMYGAESQELAIAGHTVGDVRSHLKHVLNIPADAQARVNGELKDGDYVLQENDTLEFVKVAGQKGGTARE
jgi:molybdopterin converting factor small subunit